MDENKNMTNTEVQQKNKDDKRAPEPVRLAVAISAVVIAIVIIFSLFLRQLPSNILEYDISSNKLYEVSDVTKEFIGQLQDDIEITVIQDATQIDERLVKFLDRYEKLSDKLKITYVDPIENPSVLDTMETDTDTVVVQDMNNGRRNIININGFDTYEESIFGYDYMYYNYYQTYKLNSFDADGQITSAINAVINERTQMIYYLTGHGESDMNATVEASIYKVGYKTQTVNLLKDGGMPDDCDLLIINIPTSDLADDEYNMIIEYMNGGGKALLVIDDNKLTNFATLMADFGLKINDGMLGDKSNYYTSYFQTFGYYCISPNLSSDSTITKSIKQAAMLIYPRGMTRITANHKNVSVETFMNTSSQGICYYDDNNKSEGAFIIGAVATETLPTGNKARMTIISAQYIADKDLTSTTTNMSNLDILLNSVVANFDDVSSTMNIPAKSVQLTTNNSVNTPLWNALFIAIIPLAFLAVGFVTWNTRRKR
ncbi:MAG: GldG family protein [Oscillospiraceae bacterium]|nr:GldG family protein [Oscillospiraceae bacterium]